MRKPNVALKNRVKKFTRACPLFQTLEIVPERPQFPALERDGQRVSAWSSEISRFLGLVLGKWPSGCHSANHFALRVLDAGKSPGDIHFVASLRGGASLHRSRRVRCVAGGHRLAKSLPMGMPQMFRDDDVQGAADRFFRWIAEE